MIRTDTAEPEICCLHYPPCHEKLSDITGDDLTHDMQLPPVPQKALYYLFFCECCYIGWHFYLLSSSSCNYIFLFSYFLLPLWSPSLIPHPPALLLCVNCFSRYTGNTCFWVSVCVCLSRPSQALLMLWLPHWDLRFSECVCGCVWHGWIIIWP